MLWRELSAELPEPQDQLARADAAAAHEVARGALLPAATSEAVRFAVPSLLSIRLHMRRDEAGRDLAMAEADPGREGQEAAASRAAGTELRLPLCRGGSQGAGCCAFVLSQPAGAAEHSALDAFCQELGRQLERAQQRLEVRRLGAGR